MHVAISSFRWAIPKALSSQTLRYSRHCRFTAMLTSNLQEVSCRICKSKWFALSELISDQFNLKIFRWIYIHPILFRWHGTQFCVLLAMNQNNIWNSLLHMALRRLAAQICPINLNFKQSIMTEVMGLIGSYRSNGNFCQISHFICEFLFVFGEKSLYWRLQVRRVNWRFQMGNQKSVTSTPNFIFKDFQ